MRARTQIVCLHLCVPAKRETACVYALICTIDWIALTANLTLVRNVAAVTVFDMQKRNETAFAAIGQRLQLQWHLWRLRRCRLCVQGLVCRCHWISCYYCRRSR